MASNNVIGNRQKSILKNIVSFFFPNTHVKRIFNIYICTTALYKCTHSPRIYGHNFPTIRISEKKKLRVFSWQCQHRQWRASYYNIYYWIKDILFDFLQHKLHSSNYKIMKLTCTFRCSIIPCSSGIIRPHFFFSTSKEYLTNLYTRR